METIDQTKRPPFTGKQRCISHIVDGNKRTAIVETIDDWEYTKPDGTRYKKTYLTKYEDLGDKRGWKETPL